MNRNVAKLKLLLAGMGLPKSELKNLLTEISHMNVNSLVEEVSQIARLGGSVETYYGVYEQYIDKAPRGGTEESIGRRVERLLLKEAKLSSAQAHSILSKMLIDSGLVKEDQMPPLSKKSLGIWIDRVLLLVSGKDVLNLATILRNGIVKQAPPDWTLR